MLVKIDNTPDSAAAESTIRQSTDEMTADVPIVAIAVCATVLIALTAAALIHVFTLLLMFIHLDSFQILQGR